MSSSGIHPSYIAYLASAYFLIVEANVPAAAVLTALGLAVHGMNFGSTSSIPAPALENQTIADAGRAYSF